MVGRNRRDVTTGSGQSLDHHDKRLLRLQAHERIKKLLGAGRGAAGRIDVHDNRRGARIFQPLQRLDAGLVAADQALDIDAGNRTRRCQRTSTAGGHDQADGDDRGDRNQGCGHPPKRQLAPYSAAIDDDI